ncbi:cytidine deaminase [Trichonephila inaurata madagascariensis]|uniref:Cytidine deaminase n=1 Tax=Trichonephila inaurata madagascariensis TaxID=2747483 RepID=A0A8X7CFT6_9ARAC|nr:cytidine deaminase [Trichonephila inaurata madagascariensis]
MDLKSSAEFPFPDLLKRAKTALSNSYCPYSKFSVAATLLTEDGRIFTGVNVENASYGLTICAERSAICTAVSEGCQKFKAIVIVTGSGDECIGPCGACRQFLAEFGTDWDVYFTRKDGSYVKCKVAELLPLAFVPESLQKSNS